MIFEFICDVESEKRDKGKHTQSTKGHTDPRETSVPILTPTNKTACDWEKGGGGG